jgi:hypothetical protein
MYVFYVHEKGNKFLLCTRPDQHDYDPEYLYHRQVTTKFGGHFGRTGCDLCTIRKNRESK